MDSSKPPMHPKKNRRFLANRDSSYISRRKQVQYLDELEIKVKQIQTEIANLKPKVELKLKEKNSLLMERESLMGQVAFFQQKTLLKNAELEERKVEVKKLREQELQMLTNGHPMFNYFSSNYQSNPYHEGPSQVWTPTELVPDEEEMEDDIMELIKMPENPNINDLFP